MGYYRWGFSLLGLGVYALQLLPNIIWMMAPPVNNVLIKNNSPYPILNILEQACGILTVAVLISVINPKNIKGSGLYFSLSMLFILGYYTAWFFYYKGFVNPWLLIVGIAAMPPLYFASSALWLGNYIALIPCTVFGVVHVAITSATYLK